MTSIIEKNNLIKKLNNIYEPLNSGLNELEGVHSELSSTLEELRDNITNLGYERDSLRELIDEQESELSELILLNKIPLEKI